LPPAVQDAFILDFTTLFSATAATLTLSNMRLRPAKPDIFTIRAASLDDPGRYRPQMVFYTLRRHAWDHLDPDPQKFERMPPMSGADDGLAADPR
jgi:hypothetical protein